MGTPDKDVEQKAQGRRLKMARVKAGFATAKEAWQKCKFDCGLSTYQQHERGVRGMTHEARLYASRYGVEEEWLLRGKSPPTWAQPDVDYDPEAPSAPHHLRSWRTFNRLSVDDLADALGVPPDLIQQWEGGADIPTKLLRKIADVFETTPGLILDVDPASVPEVALKAWVRQVEQQRHVQEELAALKTGTGG